MMTPQTNDRSGTGSAVFRATPERTEFDEALAHPYYSRAKVFAGIGLTAALVGLIALAIIPACWIEALVFSGIGTLVGLILAATFALAGRSADRQLTKFRESDFLTYWTYAEDEWRRFMESEHRSSVRAALWSPLVIIMLGLIVTGIMALDSRDAATLLTAWTIIGGLALLCPIILWIGAHCQYQRYTGRPSVAYFGEKMIYFGERLQRVDCGNVLCEIDRTEPTAVLQVTLRPLAGTSRYDQIMRIPVPAGREAEAEWLADILCRWSRK